MSASAATLNQAPSQLTRVLEAPQPEAVSVDGRSVAQLLAFAARFGPLVQFWDLNDHREGNWRAFFASDAAAAHALHGALDLHEIETQLRRLLRDCRHAPTRHRRHERLRDLQNALLRLVAVLDRAPDDEGALHPRWNRLLTHPRRDALRRPLQDLLRHGADRLHLDGPGHDHGHHHDHERPWLDGLWHLIEDFIAVLIEALRQGARAALDAADAAVRQRGHAPQAALFNAFALLFAEARQELNRFPRRLLDFYQQEILRQRQVAARPDQVFLTFTLAQGVTQADIARGALFTAGNDAQGQAIRYAADNALDVGPAAVTGLRVHRVSYPGGDVNRPAGVLSGVVSDPGVRMDAFPLFGCDQLGQFGALTMTTASLGFAIASPTLMLTGGQRGVRILLKPATALEGDPAGMVKAAGQAFALYYSSAGAWVAVQDVRFSAVEDGSHAFELAFDLPADAPSMVALSTPANAAAPIAATVDTRPASAFPAPAGQPAIVAQLLPQTMDQAGSDSLYALLSLLELTTVTVQVTVRQLPPAALRSPDGALYPQQTMAILGLKPAQYGALDIQAPELFVKPVSSLSLSITWVGLPVNSTGFLGYYQGYRLDANGQVSATPLFDNSSFLVGFSVNTPGLWDVGAGTTCLFQTSTQACAASGPLLQTSRLTVPGLTPTAAPPSYYDPAASALRMTLAGPAYAFGQALYASNLTAASSANVAALRAGAPPAGTAPASAGSQLAKAAAVNADAPDRGHAGRVRTALQQAIASLNGQALAALQQAIRQNVASPERQADHLKDLGQAMTPGAAGGTPWWRRLWPPSPDAHDIAARLKAWAEAHEGELAGGALTQALSLLGSATSLGGTAGIALKCAATVARPILDAALQRAQQDVAQVNVQQAQASTAGEQYPLPSAPWLPQASAVTLDYTAEATVALQTLEDGGLGAPGEFLHLYPFRQLRPAKGLANGVSLLPEVDSEAALYIDLSASADTVSLLFTLKTDLEIWSDEQPRLIWEQDEGGGNWAPLKLLEDSTRGLLNSGIVGLRLLPLDGKPRLRVRLLSGLDNMPWVSAVSSNALSATWVGPGGATRLGQPLPAGSITQSVDAIAGLGGIQQPMPSLGGRAQLEGHGFDVWMAERLRHKGYASTGWDYARLCLAAIPTLWQAAVVPATDALTGACAPGKVWVIAVAGPGTPDVDDRTQPMVDASILGEIHGLLDQVVGPFVDVQVSNPPYVRLTVTAEVIFSDADTVDHWLARLQAELVRWLSPWPDVSLGPRPPDYYTREAIAEFIRQRDYVQGISRIHLSTDGDIGRAHYFTSAVHHQLSGTQGRSA